jgi:hypothetical protein
LLKAQHLLRVVANHTDILRNLGERLQRVVIGLYDRLHLNRYFDLPHFHRAFGECETGEQQGDQQ